MIHQDRDDLDWEAIREPAEPDQIGSIRVCQTLRTIAIYIKVAENAWQPVYVDPRSSAALVPNGDVSECVAGFGDLVFTPKPIAAQHE